MASWKTTLRNTALLITAMLVSIAGIALLVGTVFPINLLTVPAAIVFVILVFRFTLDGITEHHDRKNPLT